jgi:hypothetical protein
MRNDTKSRTGIRRWLARAGVAALVAIGPASCDSGILEVTDPDIILDANSPRGALALRNGVFLRLSQAVDGIQGPDAFFVFTGLMADEWRSGDTFVQRNNQDQRVFQPDNTFNAGPYRSLNRVRVEGERAIRGLRTFWPDSTATIGAMFALGAYVEVLMAENYCNGTPLSNIDGSTLIFGNPMTNSDMLGVAIPTADSALAQAGIQVARADVQIAQADSGLANPTPADTARWRAQRVDGVRKRNDALQVQNLAAVVKGRALVNLGQFTAAAAAVASVPTTFKFQAFHSATTSTNQVWALNNSARRYTIPNGREGGVGIDFVTPNDPRLPRQIGGAVVFDNSVPMTLVRQSLYGQYDAIPIATGIEARLIEAEAQLQPGGTPATWLNIINTLRTDASLYPPIGSGFTTPRGGNLTALADPVADTARQNVHFRERAFWMFSTGHRLGDMRRLLRQYGRTEAEVYPNGAFVKGGSYGDATMMPVPFDEYNNPNFTGCIDRNP